MRLHRLEVRAFGPFATTATVDFDRLSEAGLFLLTGPTGAGKTSVLDAVCFALYGDVPGDRSTAKRLRSDQAGPDVVPSVTLEATLSGRRFRIVRSPAWERPKRRGSGTTRQQAGVQISERLAGAWHPLTSRLDEAGDLVSGLVGMNLTQFTQVAMLPQGRFWAFLRARSEERHQLLQQLFRTGRFEQVEGWLRDRRLALRREHDVVHRRVADVVSRVSEAAHAPLPDAADLSDLSPLLADDTLTGWVRALAADAVAGRGAAEQAHALATSVETARRDELERARSRAAFRARHAAARAERESLEADDEAQQIRVRTLDRARRAVSVAPLQQLTTAAGDALLHATHREHAARAAAERHLARPLDKEALRHELASATQRTAAALAARSREERRTSLVGELETLRSTLADLDARIIRAGEQQETLPSRVAGLRGEVEAAQAAATRVAALTTAIHEARARSSALREVDVLTLEHGAARAAWLDSRETTLQRKDDLIALREARIDGMAAELACALAVGASCPVCGSAEHPHKADPAPGSPDAEAERVAQSSVDDAESVELAHDQHVRGIEARLATARALAGDETAATLEQRIAELEADLATSTGAAQALPDLVTRLESAQATLATVGESLSAWRPERAACQEALTSRTDEVARLDREIDAVLAGSGLVDLGSFLSRQRRSEQVCAEALARADEHAAAVAAEDDARTRLAEAAAAAGFGSAEEAAGSTLAVGEVEALAEAVSGHRARLAAVSEVLSEADDEDALLGAEPDVGAATSAHRQALDDVDEAAGARSARTAQADRLAQLTADLAAVLTDWAPLRADLDLATHLSSFVEGKSADNLRRMRLSAYVLAYRLTQVVAAANERLATMSDQRYSLEHTADRGAGETRGGLSLLVRDDWSGEARDPATLSGGETFVVSLALALGLADVITQEAGGASLDTLFVDEGFGSLDADTLEDVMTTLDSLRDGGRVVGVVSHVADMRDRIPTQLHVAKAPSGSTTTIVG